MTGHEGVDVHNARYPFRSAVCNASCHHPAIAVPNERHLLEILELEHAKYVGDMCLEVDVTVSEMGALAKSGISRSEQQMTTAFQ